jgi:hypothetical protein
MADKRIRDLNIENNPLDSYVIPIDDISYTEAKKITVGDIRAMYRGTTSPNSTDILWLNINTNIIYWYDPNDTEWVPLTGIINQTTVPTTTNSLWRDSNSGIIYRYDISTSNWVPLDGDGIHSGINIPAIKSALWYNEIWDSHDPDEIGYGEWSWYDPIKEKYILIFI